MNNEGIGCTDGLEVGKIPLAGVKGGGVPSLNSQISRLSLPTILLTSKTYFS